MKIHEYLYFILGEVIFIGSSHNVFKYENVKIKHLNYIFFKMKMKAKSYDLQLKSY